MSRSSEGQCHTDLSKNVCELINEKVITGKQNFNTTCLRRPTARLTTRTDS